MPIQSEKPRADSSAETRQVEGAAQRKTFRDEEAAIRKHLRRLSRRTGVLHAINSLWAKLLVGLVGLYLWWRGSLGCLGHLVEEFGLPASAVPIAAVVLVLVAAAWIQNVSEKLAQDRFDFLGETRQVAEVALTRWGEDAVDRRRHGARLFRLLAEDGDAPAQIQTGILHAEQVGTFHDPGEAVRWFRRAAALKHAGAMRRLGDCYVRGLGVKRDYAEAVRWYSTATTEAGRLGHPRSLWNLGYMYATGMGVEKNLSEARRHYSNAATSQLHLEDRFALEGWWQIGPHREAYREIGKACRLAALDEEAAVWLGWAADEGDDEARRACSELVHYGVAWLRRAAAPGRDVDDDPRYQYPDHGDPDAQTRLGHLYVQGRGVPRDPAAGEAWYRTALAHRTLLDFSPALDGAPYDVEEGVTWLREKAEAEASDSTLWWTWEDARTTLRRLRRDYG